MNEKYVEADVYTLLDKILLNGHAEMFTNTKVISPILQIYKSNSLEDVICLYLEKFKCDSLKMQENF